MKKKQKYALASNDKNKHKSNNNSSIKEKKSNYFLILYKFFKALYRSSGYSIYAFYDDTFDPASPSPNDLVYHHDPMSGCPAPIQNITVNRPARQIVFTNKRPAGFNSTCLGYNSNLYTSIEICEIKVMGKTEFCILKNKFFKNNANFNYVIGK